MYKEDLEFQDRSKQYPDRFKKDQDRSKIDLIAIKITFTIQITLYCPEYLWASIKFLEGGVFECVNYYIYEEDLLNNFISFNFYLSCVFLHFYFSIFSSVEMKQETCWNITWSFCCFFVLLVFVSFFYSFPIAAF